VGVKPREVVSDVSATRCYRRIRYWFRKYRDRTISLASLRSLSSTQGNGNNASATLEVGLEEETSIIIPSQTGEEVITPQSREPVPQSGTIDDNCLRPSIGNNGIGFCRPQHLVSCEPTETTDLMGELRKKFSTNLGPVSLKMMKKAIEDEKIKKKRKITDLEDWMIKKYEIQTHLARLDPEKSQGKIQRYKNTLRGISNKSFRLFANAIGVKGTDGPVVYEKKFLDDSIENAVGSLNKVGTGIFKYPGLNPIYLVDDVNVAKMFSIYLTRKCMGVYGPDALPEAERKFVGRITTPHPRLTDEVVKYVRLVSRAIFKPRKIELVLANSRKACVEIPRSKGGKRQIAYLGEGGYTRDHVVPCAILSGGKVRTITLDSAANSRFEVLNKAMLDAQRPFPYCCAGQLAREWVQKIEFNGTVVSGDLEDATDNLNSQVSEIVIEEACRAFGLDQEDIDDIFSFTTRAKFYNRKGHFLGQQQRGQLMGSIISFPALCIISFIAGTYYTHHGDNIRRFISLYEINSEYRYIQTLRNYIMTINDMGVNGDDIVLTANPDQWMKGVEIVGGTVSRGKSLVSKELFTINSEIFRVRPDHSAYQINCVRPSLIEAIAGKVIPPANHWKEFFASEVRPSGMDSLWEVERNLFPSWPTTLGGAAWYKKEELEENDYVDFLYLREVRVKPAYDAPHHFEKKTLGTDGLIHPSISVTDYDEEKNVLSTGWYKKEKVEEWAKATFGAGKQRIKWSQPEHTCRSKMSIISMAENQYRYLTVLEKKKIDDLYHFVWEREQAGEVMLEEPNDPGRILGCPNVAWRKIKNACSLI